MAGNERVSRICRPGNGGLILPLLASEQTWPDPLRAVLYGFAMIYCFLGVSMVADTFVEAIDVITSRRRRVKKSGKVQTAPVWNEVVANLSLMALGSSAPEIFLSAIDLFRRDMHAGDLGSATIVGSAAFNLLVIVAVCIACIPSNEVRLIESTSVYYVTALFSVFAYLWLVVVLVINTPDVIDIGEGVATLLMFPVLIYVSYKTDTGLLRCKIFRRRSCGEPDVPAGLGQEDLQLPANRRGSDASAGPKRTSVRSNAGGSMAATSTKAALHRRGTVAMQKSQLLSKLTASRTRLSGAKGWASESQTVREHSTLSGSLTVAKEGQVLVELLATTQCLSRRLPTKPVVVVRCGNADVSVEVHYVVYLLDAQGDASFEHPREPQIHHRGSVVLSAGEAEARLFVDRPSLPSGMPQDFAVRLVSASAIEDPKVHAALGSVTEAQILTEPDGAGVLSWAIPLLSVQAPEGPCNKRLCTATVLRKGGCVGEVVCAWRVKGLSAVPDFDYVDAQGVLRFPEGVTEQLVEFQVLGKRHGRLADDALLVLEPCESGEPVTFDEDEDGGPDMAIAIISIQPSEGHVGSRVMRALDGLINVEHVRKGNADWLRKWPEALFCNGSLEEQRNASCSDWGFHLFALPWKLLFAFVPPTTYAGGWVCFNACLFWIGVVTGALADLAELFGCVCGLPDFVTAISLVALGTSMPDLFASKSAATGDDTADASIINVTGSNSVNVFLGLGLPWTIGSIYWAMKGRTPEWEERYPEFALKHPGKAVFVLQAGDLGFGVLAFSVACVVSLLLLSLRRSRLGAELGGPLLPKVLSTVAFVSLWVSYIVLASWRSMRGPGTTMTESLEVFGPTVALSAGTVLAAVASIMCHRAKPKAAAEEGTAAAGAAERQPPLEPEPELAPEPLPSAPTMVRPLPLPEESDAPFVPDVAVKTVLCQGGLQIAKLPDIL